jgi:serine/threonine protein kinase
MPVNAPCPTADDYHKLLTCARPPGVAEALSGHLETCPRCLDTVRTVLDTNPFAREVQSAGVPFPADSIPSAVIARLLERGPANADVTDTFDGHSGPGTKTPEPTPSEPPGPIEFERLAEYRIVRRIGRGGMGSVYEAEDTALNRRVALKVISAALAASADQRARFTREARAAAAINHDHVCPIYQVGEANGRSFLAMPLLAGETLAGRLRRESKLPVAAAVRVAREIAEGLVAAHAAGIIHRDIKPANVWLEALAGKPERVRLLDFGLACPPQEDGLLTAPGSVIGTPAYMAPEQARGKKVDERADLFSLGVVLYEMLAGRRPFAGRDPMSILASVLADDPVPPKAHAAEIPSALSALVVRLLAKDRTKRPPSAQAVVDELLAIERALHREPPSRRRWRVVTAAALVLATLTAATYKLVFETKDGTLVVELGEGVDARFKGGELHIYDEAGKQRYTLAPGDRNKAVPAGRYFVKVAGVDGLALETDEFKLEKGGSVTLRVRATPPAPATAQAAPKPAAVPGDPHRALAEWVLAHKGEVNLAPEITVAYRPGDRLPNGPITVAGIRINLAAEADAQELLRLLRKPDLPSGTTFWLSGRGYTDAWAKEAFALPALRRAAFLLLGDTAITAEGWKHFRRDDPNEFFHIGVNSGPDGDARLKALIANCSRFDQFGFDAADITDAGVKAMVERGVKIGELYLGSNPKVTDASVPEFVKIPNLKRVELGGTGVTAAGRKQLAELAPHLEIYLENKPDEVVEAVRKRQLAESDAAAQRKLAEWLIKQGGQYRIESDPNTSRTKADPLPAGAFKIAALEVKLEWEDLEFARLLGAIKSSPGMALRFVGGGFTDNWLREAATSHALRNCSFLLFADAPLSADGLKHLGRDNPNAFFAFSCFRVPMGDAGVRALARALVNNKDKKGLVSGLTLHECGVTDDGVKSLAGGDITIGELYLGNSPKMTDASAAEVAKIPTLKLVRLDRTGFTAVGKKKLAELAPKLEILPKDGP